MNKKSKVYNNSFYEQAFNEIYILNTLISMVKNTCERREYSGDYYGISKEASEKLSNERNEYINMLTVVSDKISHLIKLNLLLEKEMTLQKNTDNCCG